MKSLSRAQLCDPRDTMLLHPWDFLGKSTGVGCHFLLQEIFLTQGSNPGLLHCRQMLYRLSHQGSWQQSLLWFQQSGVKARPHHLRRRCHHYQSVTSNTTNLACPVFLLGSYPTFPWLQLEVRKGKNFLLF